MGRSTTKVGFEWGEHRTRFSIILFDTWPNIDWTLHCSVLDIIQRLNSLFPFSTKQQGYFFFFKIFTISLEQTKSQTWFWLKDKDGSLRHWLSSVAPTPHHKPQPTVATSHPWEPFPIIKISTFSHPWKLFPTPENFFSPLRTFLI